METKNVLIISPKTKVMQLIETYPHLEEVLINYVPAFKKLRNPFLKKTVAKIATLQQAAAIGNVKVEDLINLLRKEVGQDSISLAGDISYNTKQPEWYGKSKVKKELDIREMLNAGEHPVNQVMSELNNLESGEIFLVIAPFIPAPLIDKALSLELDYWVEKKNEELFNVYFVKLKG
jgi:uncharacterized protein (DUF2249 family)